MNGQCCGGGGAALEPPSSHELHRDNDAGVALYDRLETRPACWGYWETAFMGYRGRIISYSDTRMSLSGREEMGE